MAAADVVVMPSRYDTTPLTLLEAMAAGTSVVVSDVPGVGEVLEGATEPVGAAVPAGAGGALVEELAVRLADRPRCHREGSAARRHVGARYGIRPWLDRLAQLAETAVRGHAASAPRR
jgi:glycosyltransferase involved in cell wall biosynthesis